MYQEGDNVPELPPSPLQYSVGLYALPDIEHLASGVAQGSDPSIDVLPVPRRLSIPLYPLSELPLLENSHIPAQTDTQLVPEPQKVSISLYSLPDVDFVPDLSNESEDHLSPKSLSVDLYPLTNVAHVHGDPQNPQASLDVMEIPPSPTFTFIDLHPLPTVEHLLSADAQHESTGETDATREPLPLLHSVELVSAMGASHAQESPQSDILPLSPDASASTHNDLSGSEVSIIPQDTPTSGADFREGPNRQTEPSTQIQTPTVDDTSGVEEAALPSTSGVSASEANVKSQDDPDVGPEEPFDRRQRQWITRRDPRR